jgi:hypothetical protein
LCCCGSTVLVSYLCFPSFSTIFISYIIIYKKSLKPRCGFLKIHQTVLLNVTERCFDFLMEL